ncbi:MAG TPA: hypothetical protein VF455_09910, partial [Chryseobacterium sp.]
NFQTSLSQLFISRAFFATFSFFKLFAARLFVATKHFFSIEVKRRSQWSNFERNNNIHVANILI